MQNSDRLHSLLHRLTQRDRYIRVELFQTPTPLLTASPARLFATLPINNVSTRLLKSTHSDFSSTEHGASVPPDLRESICIDLQKFFRCCFLGAVASVRSAVYRSRWSQRQVGVAHCSSTVRAAASLFVGVKLALLAGCSRKAIDTLLFIASLLIFNRFLALAFSLRDR